MSDAADRTGLPDPRATSPATGWIRAARDGDARALHDVFSLLRRRLLRIVALRTHRQVDELDPDVEDIVQDALLVAVREFDAERFSSGGAMMRWLATIALNDLRDRARWRAVRKDLVELRTAMASAIGDGRGSPLADVYEHELERATDQAMARLSDEDREILVLRNYEGASAAEIATALDLRSEEAARVRLLRARRRLEKHLQPFFSE